MPRLQTSLLRIRVVKVYDKGNAEVTNDLPHLHQTHIDVVAFQPGNPGSNALGSFSIPLHPPGTKQYKAAKAIYDQLDFLQRVEMYISKDGASLGRLYYAGIITNLPKSYDANSNYALTGVADFALANKARPFPGEFLSNDVTSAILKSYLGYNEAGASDTFNPYTAANYVSTNLPGGTAGTWTGTTDDGMNVVTNSTGTGAVLLSKAGAAANDRWHSQYVQMTGRVTPSADATRAAEWGCGFSLSAANINDCVLGFVVAKKANGRYLIDVGVNTVTAGVGGTAITALSVLMNADDPQVVIPFTLGFLWTVGGGSTSSQTVSLMVNGKVCIGQIPAGPDPGTSTRYPFLYSRTPNSGTANYYFANLLQKTRFTTDGPSTAAAFGNGTISVSTHSLGWGVDPGPTLLETWAKLATREGWYLRYTPTAYVIGTRTLGTVDFAADPGTDRTTSVIFNRLDGSLTGLAFTENADPLANDIAAVGQPTYDGGGHGHWSGLDTISRFGLVETEMLAYTHSDFGSLRAGARQITANLGQVGTAGSKKATVLHNPSATWRELDQVKVNDPEMGLNYQTCRIMAYTFDEGQPTQTLTLDQHSAETLT